jgi:undecaprenyl-diphosphatase
MLRNWLEPRILGVILAATSALWVFIEVAEEVVEGDTHAIDAAILLSLRAVGDPADPLGPRWLEEFARDVTALGSPGVLALLVLVTIVFLLLAGRYRTSLFLLAATTSGAIASALLKQSFARPRPDLVPHEVYVSTASFPSGHAMISAVVYLTLGALVARLVPRRRLKLYVLSVAALLTGLIGMSRVYLGVHWPSDVLAGWAAGAAWALGCWVAAQTVHLGDGVGGDRVGGDGDGR